MKTLETLIKLQKTRVDEQRQVLAKLQDKLAALEASMAQLEIEKAREQLVAQDHPETASTFGLFLKSMIEKERTLEKERQAVARGVDLARDYLIEMFEEQKRYEIAEETRRREEAQAIEQRETSELDEVGSVRFTRNKD